MAEPFLIGDAMTGGYGAGPDILHSCTIAVDPGQNRSDRWSKRGGKIHRYEGRFWHVEPARWVRAFGR